MIALYIRKSVLEVDGFSIEGQIEKTKAYCKMHDWKDYKTYVDNGKTGANMDREGLKQLLADIDKGRISKVIVYKLDRLSRSQKDTLYLIEDCFLKNNVEFISISESFDTTSPFGRAMIGILSVFAQLERENIRERTMLGKVTKAKKGTSIAPFPPLGYKMINNKLIVDEKDSLIVKDIFEMYANGISKKAIQKFIKDKYGSIDRCTHLDQILTRQTYIGKVKCGDELYDGNHEAIIDIDTWNKAQKLLDGNRETYSYSFKINSLLGGLLYCGQCNCKAYADSSKKKYKDKVYVYRRYKCENHAWNQRKINKIIIDEIKKVKYNPEALFEEEEGDHQDTASVWEKEIKELNKKIEKVMELYELGTIPAELLSDRISKLSNQKTIAENNLAKEQSKIKKTNSKENFIENLKLFDNIENLSEMALRQIVCLLIDKIVIDGDSIKIFWAY